jgi:hypothetical protein
LNWNLYSQLQFDLSWEKQLDEVGGDDEVLPGEIKDEGEAFRDGHRCQESWAHFRFLTRSIQHDFQVGGP